jgi:DNA-3-methyladenine glycosylase I
MKSQNPIVRCAWPGLAQDALMTRYHDEEWGVPLHDDRDLFELLTLEGAQAGLSWHTVLTRRDNYRRAFDNFDIRRVATYCERDVERLVSEAGIIRSRRKIESTIGNARAVLAIQREFSSFDTYLWRFVGGGTIQHRFRKIEEVPARTADSEAMSKEMLRRGFLFVGPTSCYALMQSAGLVNDHLVSCFRYESLRAQMRR